MIGFTVFHSKICDDLWKWAKRTGCQVVVEPPSEVPVGDGQYMNKRTETQGCEETVSMEAVCEPWLNLEGSLTGSVSCTLISVLSGIESTPYRDLLETRAHTHTRSLLYQCDWFEWHLISPCPRSSSARSAPVCLARPLLKTFAPSYLAGRLFWGLCLCVYFYRHENKYCLYKTL